MKYALAHPALASFLLALLLRVSFAAFENGRSGSRLEWPDEELHWQIARNLAQHGQFATDDGRLAARMPLYPLFLTPFAMIGSGGISAARIAQAVLSALVVPIGVWLARRAFGQRASRVAGVLLALDPFATYFAARLLTEAPFSLAAAGLIAAVWRNDDLDRRFFLLLRDRSFVRVTGWRVLLSVSIGPLAAMTILLRQSSIGWIAALLLALWLLDYEKLRATARLVRHVLVIGVLMLPWGVRNRAALGDFAWLSANGGVTLYDAQGPQADGSSNQAFLNEMPQLAGLSEIALDRELTRRAIEQMQRDPWRVLRLAGVKSARMWSPLPNVAEYRGGVAAWAGAVYTVVVIVLAIAAAWRAASGRAKRRARLLQFQLWLPVIVFTLLHCIYIGSVRYRVPLMPMLAISAAGVAAPALRRTERLDAARAERA